MFGFQLETMHTFKDNVYDDNNNVIKFVYQALVTTPQGLEWTLNTGKFNMIGETLPKNSWNIFLMLSTILFIANAITNDFQINNELIGVIPNHKTTFIDLCDFSNKDGTLLIFVHPFNSSLLILTYFVQILSTCCLKFTLLFSVWWKALRQCLLPSMPPWSWKYWIMIHFGLKILLTFHPLLMVVLFLNSPLFIIQMAILARWQPFLVQGQDDKHQEWFQYKDVNWNRI